MPDITRKTISATEASALLDASPYTTRWMLYQRFAKGTDLDKAADERMNWGKLLEPLVLTAVAEELRLEVIPNRDGSGEQVYQSRGLFGCTKDATIICPDRGPGALETKCVFDYGAWMRDWNGGKNPPRHNEIQLQVQMYVGDGDRPFDWGCLTAWLAGELHHFERKPIPELWEKLEGLGRAFFDDVAAGREPDPFGSPVEVPFLVQCFPLEIGNPLMMDDANERANIDLAEQVRLLSWHSGERLGHERMEKELKALLLGVAKEHDEIRLPYGIKVAIKQQSRAGYTVKPTTFKVVTPYVPDSVPVGNIQDIDDGK